MGILRLMHMPEPKKKNRQTELDVTLNSAMMHSPVLTPADIYAATVSLRDGTYVAGRASVLVGGKPHIITVVEQNGKSTKDIEAKIAKETKGKVVEFASYRIIRSSNDFTGQQTVKIEQIEEAAKKEKGKSQPTLRRG